MFKMQLSRWQSKPVETPRSTMVQIGGVNNVQNVKAGGKITLVGNKNNVQNVEAGGDITVITTQVQIGGKGNVQRIE